MTPVFGYRSISAFIMDKHRAGRSTKWIAGKLGQTEGYVRGIITTYERADEAKKTATGPASVKIPSRVAGRLTSEARRLGVPAEALARSILTSVIDGGLVDKVMQRRAA